MCFPLVMSYNGLVCPLNWEPCIKFIFYQPSSQDLLPFISTGEQLNNVFTELSALIPASLLSGNDQLRIHSSTCDCFCPVDHNILIHSVSATLLFSHSGSCGSYGSCNFSVCPHSSYLKWICINRKPYFVIDDPFSTAFFSLFFFFFPA